MTLLAYFIAFVAAHFASIFATIASGALLQVLRWRGLSHPLPYFLSIASGIQGQIQRAVIGFVRACVTMSAVAIVLSLFQARFTLTFAAFLVVWFTAGEV